MGCTQVPKVIRLQPTTIQTQKIRKSRNHYSIHMFARFCLIYILMIAIRVGYNSIMSNDACNLFLSNI